MRQVDAQNGTVTLQDGRVLHVNPGTFLWQPVTLGSVVPGTAVFVRNAEPLDFQPATARAVQMGTISTVDASRSQVVLSDGTVVQLRRARGPASTVSRSPSQGLRAGDEIVVGLPPTATVSVTPLGAPVSALPRGALGVIEADSISRPARPSAVGGEANENAQCLASIVCVLVIVTALVVAVAGSRGRRKPSASSSTTPPSWRRSRPSSRPISSRT